MKVLLCTDDNNTQEDICLIFKLAFPDCNLIVTATKNQCIDSINQNPDIFIVSVNDIDGTFDFNFIKKLRNLSPNPIVIISSTSDDTRGPDDMVLLKVMRSGADLYISEPVNNIVFIAKLRSLINREVNRINKNKPL
jgi:DNA-binding response OmpR family regulator